MTPDDEARLSSDLWNELVQPFEREFLYQPRQNVLFEAGVAYGRAPERTVLIRVGSYLPMTDLAGHHILQLDNSAQSRQAVADALKVAGLALIRLDLTDLRRAISHCDSFRGNDRRPVSIPVPSAALPVKAYRAQPQVLEEELHHCAYGGRLEWAGDHRDIPRCSVSSSRESMMKDEGW